MSMLYQDRDRRVCTHAQRRWRQSGFVSVSSITSIYPSNSGAILRAHDAAREDAMKRRRTHCAGAEPSPVVSLPPGAIFDILTRLPVKPLCRFRCVSKQWRVLISEPAFVASRRRHLPRRQGDRARHNAEPAGDGHGRQRPQGDQGRRLWAPDAHALTSSASQMWRPAPASLIR